MVMSPYDSIEMSPLERYDVVQKGGWHYGSEGDDYDEYRGVKED